jgi:hypothetical protein
MDKELRQIHAAIAFTGIPKKVYARYCGVSKSLFSMYLSGDATMPPNIRERLYGRIRENLKAVKDDTPAGGSHSALQNVGGA